MSSAYPPFGGVPSQACQRCGAPVPVNEAQCRNCGYNRAPAQPPAPFPPQPPAPFPPQPPAPFPPQPTTNSNNRSGSFSGPQQASSQPAWASQKFSQPAQSSMHANAQPPTMTGSFPSPGNIPPATPRPTPPHRGRARLAMALGLVALVLVVIAAVLLGSSGFSGGQPTQAQQATPSATPLFSDDFGSNTHNWNLQSMPGQFSAALDKGALMLEDDHHDMLWELVPGQGNNKTFGNFQLRVDATQTKGDQDNGYGVFIRGTLNQDGSDFTTFYRFTLYGDGSFAVYKGVADTNGQITNTPIVNDTINSAIASAGGVNHIVIDAKGSTLTFIVNGHTLTTVSDNSFASGLSALFVNNLTTSKNGAQATFSHLRIYPL